MFRAIALLSTVGFLTACGQEQRPPANDGPPQAGCSADTLQHHVGQPVDQIDRDSLPKEHRIISPGIDVTMDFREDRLNIEHDAEEIVTRIYCG